MNEIERIVQEVHRSFESRTWYGSSLLETLADVDAVRAAAYPIPGLHSIWEQVHHILYTQQILIERLSGRPLPWNHAEDWPPVSDTSETAWRRTLETLRQTEVKLEQLMAGFSAARLDEPLDPAGTTVARTINGHAQHNAYHAGQIMLLKKAAR